MGGGIGAVTVFCGDGVEADEGLAAAPLEAGVVFSGVDQEAVEGDEQEGTELAAATVDGTEVVLLDEEAEELLGEVLGVLGGSGLMPDVGVKGVPILVAETFEGIASRRGVGVGGEEDIGPGGGDETAGTGLWQVLRRVGLGH
jgi:hypothetical protein